jgi:cholinesterase
LIGSNQNESFVFSNIPPKASPEQDIQLNNGFRCGTAEAAKARALHDVPVWRYHYSGTNGSSTMGATHGADVRLVFDGDSGLSKVFQTAWGAFAKDPARGLTKLGWPKYNPSGT